jgi:diacylglycerol kinase (ATP)
MSALRRPLVILNPRARAGRAGREANALFNVMDAALGGVDTVFTERPSHATSLAEEAAMRGRETVIAVGGDGSIHEIVWGLMRARAAGADGTRLGIVPHGTGGDFRRTLFDLGRDADRHPAHRLERYLEVIAAGHTRAVDVGEFTFVDNEGVPKAGYFINILSAGMGGLTDRYVHDASRFVSGKAAYFIASFRGLLDSAVAPLALDVELGGKKTTHTLHSRQISICNGRFFGSGMFVAPMASIDDGVLEIVDLGDASKMKFALDSSAIYTGKHMQNPRTVHLRAERLTLRLLDERLTDRFLLDVDGEPLGRLPIDVSVRRGALPVFAPPMP